MGHSLWVIVGLQCIWHSGNTVCGSQWGDSVCEAQSDHSVSVTMGPQCVDHSGIIVCGSQCVGHSEIRAEESQWNL